MSLHPEIELFRPIRCHLQTSGFARFHRLLFVESNIETIKTPYNDIDNRNPYPESVDF